MPAHWDGRRHLMALLRTAVASRRSMAACCHPPGHGAAPRSPNLVDHPRVLDLLQESLEACHIAAYVAAGHRQKCAPLLERRPPPATCSGAPLWCLSTTESIVNLSSVYVSWPSATVLQRAW